MQTFLGALSSAWLEHHLDMVGVGGSSPLGRTIKLAVVILFFLCSKATISIFTSIFFVLYIIQFRYRFKKHISILLFVNIIPQFLQKLSTSCRSWVSFWVILFSPFVTMRLSGVFNHVGNSNVLNIPAYRLTGIEQL